MTKKPCLVLLLIILVVGVLPGCRSSGEALAREQVKDIAMSQFHTVLLATDGSIWAMGRCDFGELGKSATRPMRTAEGDEYLNRPVRIMSDIKEVAATNYCSLMLDTTGNLYAVGKIASLFSSFPDLQGPIVNPAKIMDGVQHIAAGPGHALVIKTDGSLWGLGKEPYGQLAYKDNMGAYTTIMQPVKIADDVMDAFAGPNSTFFLKADHSLWSCGANLSGELGFPLENTHEFNGVCVSLVPKLVMENVVQVSTDQGTELAVQVDGSVDGSINHGHTLVVDGNGSLWAMGSNGHGQLGEAVSIGELQVPTKIMDGVMRVVAGTNRSYALKGDGTLLTFGASALPPGQDNVVMNGVTDIWGGGDQLAIRLSSGELLFYGDNHFGQLGLPGL